MCNMKSDAKFRAFGTGRKGRQYSRTAALPFILVRNSDYAIMITQVQCPGILPSLTSGRRSAGPKYFAGTWSRGQCAQITNMKPCQIRFEPHFRDPTTDMNVSRSQIAKRRSRRMFLNATVALSGEDHLKCSFAMPARATHLNRHGASVQVSRDLVVGSVIVVRNKRSTQSLLVSSRRCQPQKKFLLTESNLSSRTAEQTISGEITLPLPENRLASSRAVEQAGIGRRRP